MARISIRGAGSARSTAKWTTLLTMGTGLLGQALVVVTGVVTARMLGVEGRGEFAACTLVPLLMISLGDLGGSAASTYLSARNPGLAPTLARHALLVTLALSVLLIALSVIVTEQITDGYGDITRKVLFFSIGAIPLAMLARNLNAINQGTGELVRFNLVRLVNPLVYCILIIGLSLAGHQSVNLALGAWVISAIVYLAAASSRLRGSFQHGKWIDQAILRTTYQYGFRAHLGSVAPIDTFRLDLVLVIAILSPHDAGLYAVAVAVASLVRSQATTMGMVALPAVARHHVRAVQLAVARKFVVATVGIVVVLALVLSFTAADAIALFYGKDFRDAATVAVLLVWAMVIASVRQALGDALRALGSPGAASISEAVSWLASIPAVVLVHQYGLNGAAYGVILAYSISLMVTLLMPASHEVLRQALTPSLSNDSQAAGHVGRSL